MTITINLKMENGKIKEMDIVKDIYDRTEYCDGEEISIQDALSAIEEYLSI